jgi:DNA-binding CsgD family transcriptional regulator
VSSFVKYQNPVKGKNAGLAKFNKIIYYASKDGIYKLDNKTKQFKKDSVLTTFFEKDLYKSGKMIVDDSNKIWLFSENYVHYFSLGKLNNSLKQNVIPISSSLTNSMSGFENLSQISSSDYLIGTTDGYYTVNINDLTANKYAISIFSIESNKLDNKYKNKSIKEKGVFTSAENNISFGYTIPEYNKYINFDFQYLLEGLHEEWSEWNSKSNAIFKNLPPGDYTFRVRAKFAESILKNTESYSFTISKPWYGTNLAVFIYILVLICCAYFINKLYINYYHKKEEKLIEENNLLLEIQELENEQQLMRIKNDQLSQDVDYINKELAVSAMDLNSKNELLAFIREDLKNTDADENRSIKSVISTINKNITGKDSWSVFKEAFENSDKDFFKKMKESHPTLTSNDLRLCAYLRLNLSSKEIAPLFNISVRSIEIKRYRLRKKMDLPHEQGLVEYVLAV